MKWNDECVESEQKKVKKKGSCLHGSWREKNKTKTDAEKIDSTKAEKINSRIELLFKKQITP